MNTTNTSHLSTHQYASADNLHARWDLYDWAIPKINLHQTAIEHLQLTGNENILEVGCGDGSVLLNLSKNGHAGQLSGLEINDHMFASSVQQQITENIQPPITYQVGTADNLPFPDKSVDIILAFFMLYHMPDIQKTLHEWNRVLTDEGKILISTSSTHNRPKHKLFKKLVEQNLSKTAPEQFSSSFNLENGPEQLEKVFKIIDTLIYEGQIQITDPELYLKTFRSIRDMYNPLPTGEEWSKAEQLVTEKITAEISAHGFFSDDVRRGFFICEKL